MTICTPDKFRHGTAGVARMQRSVIRETMETGPSDSSRITLRSMQATTDKFWNGAALGCEASLAPWLRDRGSLTHRIQQRCTNFKVDKVRTGPARIALDESALLSIAPQQLAYSREVFLYADDQPVVFAHSALAHEHLRSAWSAVRTLGNKPLGALLFAHPLIERKPLHYKALRNTHPLYQRAAEVLGEPPHRLWARRSLFFLHDVPLLVTEVFLPGILLLTNRYGRF